MRVLSRVLSAVVGMVVGFVLAAVIGAVVSDFLYPLSPDPGPTDALPGLFFAVGSAAVGALVGLVVGIWLPPFMARRRAGRSAKAA